MEFGHAHAVLADKNHTFRGLSPQDRRLLSLWLAAVRPAGIDSVEDLGARAWPVGGVDCIIGVFKAGHLLASWLVVGQGGSWAVACCADGVVSRSFGGLADALEAVCPVAAPVMQS